MKKHTSIKSFIFNSLLLDMLLAAALVWSGTKNLEPHGVYEGIRIAIPSMIAIILCWLIRINLFKKQHLNDGTLALTYVFLPVIFSITTVVICGDWGFFFTAFLFSFFFTFVAYILFITYNLKNDA